MRSRLHVAAAAVALAPALALAPLAHAQQGYPSKVIKIVVPTAPGGGNDVMARIVASKLQERWKAAVIVENKAGANGAIASEYVARAAPDGYTLLFGYIATHGINPGLSKVPYDPVKDFAPIAEIAEAQGVLVVNPKVEAKTVKELLALAKAKPGSLSYASAGNGTAPHIAGELFKQKAGVDIVHVPYKGSGPAVMDTLAGTTQIMFPSLVAAAPHIKSGKLRAIAVTGTKRSALFPELPTIAESGVAGFEITQWYGFFAPAKTPKEIVDKLNREIVAIMKDPDTAKKFADQGADIVTGSPEDFAKFVQIELAKWSKFVKEAKITAD
ncbi:MAG: tripartite tricarboxylate transporter substrate binding protein [Burkholderiales bacterium]